MPCACPTLVGPRSSTGASPPVPSVTNNYNSVTDYRSDVSELESLLSRLLQTRSGPRSFPRTVSKDGHPVKVKEQEIEILGPFSDIMALRIRNRSLAARVFVYCKGITTRETACPIEPQEIVRPQFDCPTFEGSNGPEKVGAITIVAFADIEDADGTFIVQVE